MKRIVVVFISILMLLTACNPFSSTIKMEEDLVYEVKVLYYSTESFMSQFGDIIMATYPNIRIDVIPLPRVQGTTEEQDNAYMEVLQNEQPDLIFTPNSNRFKTLIQQDQFYELSNLMLKDSSLENYHKGVLNAIKELGGDKIYGLSSSFQRKGVFYNVEIFENANILPPSNNMTWNDLISLAEKFNGIKDQDGRPIVGLVLNDYTNIVQVITDMAATEQLLLIDPEIGLQFNTEDWRYVFSRIIKGIQEGYISVPFFSFDETTEESNEKMKFHNGTAAMTLAYDGIMNSLKDSLQWGVINEPVNLDRPDESYSVGFPHLFAINKETAVLPAAWEVLKLMNAEDFRQYRDMSNNQLFSNGADMEWKGNNVESLFKFSGKLFPPEEKAPIGFFEEFNIIAEQYVNKAVEGSITIDEAIQNIQHEGQQVWLQDLQE